jgi:septin family protein
MQILFFLLYFLLSSIFFFSLLIGESGIGKTTFLQTLEKEGLFGDKKVTSADLQNIIYDGQDAARVYMPVDPIDGSPDYKSLEHFKED